MSFWGGSLQSADTCGTCCERRAFKEEMAGDARPPVTHYQLGSPEHPFYVEFLTPLVGSENRRDGTPDIATTISGVGQKLRYLEILLLGPWAVVIGPDNGFPLERPATVAVPNAAAYVAQKLLILGRRKRQDQERDILYIHDTLQTFAAHLAHVREAWHQDVVPHLGGRMVAEINAAIRSRFSNPNDRIRGAAVIAASVGRSLPAQSLLGACQSASKPSSRQAAFASCRAQESSRRHIRLGPNTLRLPAVASAKAGRLSQ